MKLIIDRLKASPSAYTFEGDEAWWEALRADVTELAEGPARPFEFAVRAHRMGEDVFLEGELTGALELGCSRCLARYRHPLHEAFRLLLEPAGERVPAEPESALALARMGMCLGDELDTGWFRGSEIDLGEFFRELVTLAMPVQPLCQESCQGLCPRCGADRNVEQCGCEQVHRASPFEVLRALRGESDEGEG